jgi:hypothetical protein
VNSLDVITQLLEARRREQIRGRLAILGLCIIAVGCLFVAGVVCLYGTHAVLTATFAVVDLAVFGGLLWTRFFSKSARENRRLFQHYKWLERTERE